MGYLFLLLAFASLGLFVAALAVQSDLAPVAGGALAASLAAAVVGFRIGALKLNQSRGADDPGHNVSIWSKPLRQDDVDQYYVNFRGAQGPTQRDRVIAVAGEGDSEQSVAA